MPQSKRVKRLDEINAIINDHLDVAAEISLAKLSRLGRTPTAGQRPARELATPASERPQSSERKSQPLITNDATRARNRHNNSYQPLMRVHKSPLISPGVLNGTAPYVSPLQQRTKSAALAPPFQFGDANEWHQTLERVWGWRTTYRPLTCVPLTT